MFCGARRSFEGFFLHFFSRGVVSGWCVVCGAIGGLLDVRVAGDKIYFLSSAGWCVTKGRGTVQGARTWPDWPGGTVSVHAICYIGEVYN